MAKTVDQRQRKIRHQLLLRRNQQFGAGTSYRKLNKRVQYWCNKYIRLRDTGSKGWGYCCSCRKVIVRGDAGHFIGKGFGGSSGVRFDERNINFQCIPCNRFQEGNKLEYRKFMIKKYGQDVIDELERLHRTHNYTLMELEGLKLYYQQAYKELSQQLSNQG